MAEDLTYSDHEDMLDTASPPTTAQHVNPAIGSDDDKEGNIHLKLSYALGTRYCGHNLVDFLSENVVIYPAAHHLNLFHMDSNAMEFFHHTRNVQSVQCFHVSPNRELIAIAEVHHNSVPLATIPGVPPGIPPAISPQMTSHFRDQQSQHVLCIYKASTRTRIRSISLSHSANIVACSFSADNKYLAMLEDTPSHNVTYWKISNSKLIASYKCPSRGTRIHINPNNCNHISVSGPMILKYWLWTNNDFKIGNFVPQAREHEHFVDHVWIKEFMIAVSERGMLLCFRSTADCTTVDLVHSSRCHQPSYVRMECIAAHAKGFVLGGSAGFFSIYEFSDDPKDPFAFIRSVSVGDIAFECLTISPSVETIVACTKSHELVTFSMSVLDTLQEDRIDFRELIRHGHQIGAVLQVDTCIQRPIIASCGSDKTVRIWNYELRQYEILYQCSEEPIALSLHPSGFQVIVAFKERVRMYNILQESLKQTREIAIKSCRVVRYANGGHLFACASGLTVTTFHTYTVEPAHTFSGHIGAVRSLCWSSDDLSLLSAGHDGAVYRWIIPSGTRCEEMMHVVKQCQYSALVVDDDNPKLVVAAGSDGKLREILSGEETKTVDLPQGISVTCLELMKESKRLFAATNIGSVLVYSWPLSAKIIGEYFAHTEAITTLRITEDGECMATSSEDGSICIFSLNNSTHLSRASIIENQEQSIMEGFQRQTDKKKTTATFADAVLVAREDIEERQATLVEMQQNYDQLKADVEFALHRKENEWIERLRVIKDESESLVIQERVRYEDLESRYQQAARKHVEELSQKEANHVKLTQELENQYERKLAQEIARYDALSETLEQTRQRCEALIESQDNQHRTILHSERKSSYARAKDQNEVIKRLHEDLKFNHSKFEEVLHQEETEYEQELQKARSEYEKLLDNERQNTAIKQGQLSAANTKLESLAKKMQELKASSHARDIILSTEKAKVEKLEGMLVQYEKHFEHCKYSINEREKAIAGLKSSNRILENFRSVLYHRIDNLEIQQAPMQNHMSSLENHISEMQTELVEDFKSKAAMQQELERKDVKVNSLLQEVKMLRQTSLKKDYSLSEMTREFTRLAQLSNYKDLDAAVKDAYRVFVIGEIIHKRPPKAVITAAIQPESSKTCQLKGGQSPNYSSPTKRDGRVVSESKNGSATTAPAKSGLDQRSQQNQPAILSSSSDEALGYDCKQAVDESMKNVEFMSKSIVTLRAALESSKIKADRIRRDSVAEGSFLIEECNKLRKDNKVLGMRVRELESVLNYANIGVSGPPSSISKKRLQTNSSCPQLTSPQENDLTIDTGTINSPSKLIPLGSVTPTRHHRELRKGGTALPFARLEMDRDKRTGAIAKIDELKSVVDRQRSEIQRLQNQVQLLLSEQPEELQATSRPSVTPDSFRQIANIQSGRTKILRPITANPAPILHSSFVLTSPDHLSGVNGNLGHIQPQRNDDAQTNSTATHSYTFTSRGNNLRQQQKQPAAQPLSASEGSPHQEEEAVARDTQGQPRQPDSITTADRCSQSATAAAVVQRKGKPGRRSLPLPLLLPCAKGKFWVWPIDHHSCASQCGLSSTTQRERKHKTETPAMDLAIRVNVRYAAPPNSQIKDALRLFKSPRWVQSIIRYIMPQLNSVSPASVQVIDALKRKLVQVNDDASCCVVCMEALTTPCAQLPCQHQFHEHCIEPWLKMHSTCPTCRDQLPTDAYTNYSVYAINTTIILQQSQARMPTAELLELSASNQIIRAIVNARVRRNVPSNGEQPDQLLLPSVVDLPMLQAAGPVMNASVVQRGTGLSATLPPCISEPVVPMMQRNSSRRRFREEDVPEMNKRTRLSDSSEEQELSTSV